MKHSSLPSKTLLLWQIRVVMLTTILVALCLFFKARFDFLGAVGLIIAIVGFFLIMWYLPQYFKHYEINIKDEAIVINGGVFIKVSHIMPYSRLIYAQSFATPLARLFGIASVSLKAARSRVIIPEIYAKDAVRIIDSLTKGEAYDKEV